MLCIPEDSRLRRSTSHSYGVRLHITLASNFRVLSRWETAAINITTVTWRKKMEMISNTSTEKLKPTSDDEKGDDCVD